MSDEHAYRHAATLSENLKQTAINVALADYSAFSDAVPKLVHWTAGKTLTPQDVVAGKYPTPAVVAAAEIEVGKIAAEAMKARDAAVRKAEAEHYDRIALVGQHYEVANGAPRGANPAAEHAQLWFRKLIGL